MSRVLLPHILTTHTLTDSGVAPRVLLPHILTTHTLADSGVMSRVLLPLRVAPCRAIRLSILSDKALNPER